MNARHRPVLAAEVIRLLAPKPGEIWVDATTGAGGHTAMLAHQLGSTGRVLALDRDPTMLELARPRLAGLPVTLIHAGFDQLLEVLASQGFQKVDGLLADLGFCSDQMDDPARGLSFQREGPLDMRLDPTQGETAAQLLARINEHDLANLIFEFGEERRSRRIARALVAARQTGPLRTTHQVADIVRRCVPRERPGFDPATRTFQALRIAVNDELAALDALLGLLPRCIRPGGRVALISFHSLEDRRVKQALRDPMIWDLLTRKPVVATEDESRDNPRARSAKLRAARRL